jgi:hypothetical protein
MNSALCERSERASVRYAVAARSALVRGSELAEGDSWRSHFFRVAKKLSKVEIYIQRYIKI